MPGKQASFFKKAARFIPEVKQEMSRVTWASRRETTMTTIVVFIFALIAACYFLIVDQIIYRIIQWIIGVV
jgi:preprotein translocase subunit SecE